MPPEQVPKEHGPLEIFGFEIARSESNAGRQLMTRFGEIARLEAHRREVRVTLKNGTVYDLDRLEASDFDDGVRVWDGERDVVDVRSLLIRTIELLPTPPLADAPDRLHGAVRTRQGDFTGFLAWDRRECVGSDTLDGREIVLSDTAEVDDRNRGIHVDDRRYGRVLVSWDSFERLALSPGGSGPAYDDFPPGHPLTGSVTTRAGGRVAGRLVYDLDESETIETLDAPSQSVDYTIPFGLIASIVPLGREERGSQRATVTLHSGEDLQLERAGDLGQGNAGMLVFVDGRERPEYVPWSDVEQVDFDRPPAMYPPLGGR